MSFLKESSFFQLIVVISAVLMIQGCQDDPFNSTRELDFSEVPDPYELSQADTSYTLENGVEIYVIEKGETPFETVSRDEITLYFTGRKSDGEVFDSSYRNGSEQPDFIHLSPVNKAMGPQNENVPPQVEGYREGLLGMNEGEKRVIIVPPSLGYNDSNRGINGFDLRDERLRYDVELAKIHD